MYFDAHTHLNEDRLFTDRQNHVQHFLEIWGKGLINVWVDPERNQRAIQIAQLSTNKRGDQLFVKATVGIHPSEASFGKIVSSQDIRQVVEALRVLCETHSNEIVAIGECGIDAHYPDYDKVKWVQQELFHAQCALARDLSLPVVIHSRDQFTDTLEVIKNYTDLKIYFHCWGYGHEEIEILHALLPRLWIGYCGNITYPAAHKLRESIKSVHSLAYALDIDRSWHQLSLLLETDAPYLTPQSKRGASNMPAFIQETYAYVGQFLWSTQEELQQRIHTAFTDLFVRP